MKGRETEHLRRREVAAACSAANSLHLLTRDERERRDRELGALLPPPQRIFAGEGGIKLMLRAIPGFAGCWQTIVPDGYVDRVRARDGRLCWVVRCACGEQLALEQESLGECPGECGRWFLGTDRLVRVYRAPAELADAA